MQRNPDNRDGWRSVRFDEIAENVTGRVDPAEAAAEGVERYAGLAHLDSESLKIRRWGTPVVRTVIVSREWAEIGGVIASSRRREELWKRDLVLGCLTLWERPKRGECHRTGETVLPSVPH